jgi:hypothetical protein
MHPTRYNFGVMYTQKPPQPTAFSAVGAPPLLLLGEVEKLTVAGDDVAVALRQRRHHPVEVRRAAA